MGPGMIDGQSLTSRFEEVRGTTRALAAPLTDYLTADQATVARLMVFGGAQAISDAVANQAAAES